MKYYISDLHLGHQNVLRFDSRPFETLDEMHSEVIRRWNAAVSPEDEVYILGDFAWKNSVGDEVFSQLTGRKYLILGNHDKPSPLLRDTCVWIKEYAVIEDAGIMVVLNHYPIANWYGQFRGAVHLYGHVHNNPDAALFRQYLELLRENGMPAAAYNVGCMMPYMDYTPRTLTQLQDSVQE
ncbi:MAG: metallophosphoesterase [Oscillospiraceae bacterium]|nr:metallophosphoesterase [Oscillospiraceae bacterium]